MPKRNKLPKTSAKRLQDPFYARECEKYALPLPSREYVLQTLQEAGVPLSSTELMGTLEILPEEEELFVRRLFAMVRDGQIVCNRRGAYLLPDKAQLVRGKVEGHPDGYGFVLPDEGGADIFLGPKEMREVLHGDHVLVRISGVDRKGRPEGKVVEVLEHSITRVVGRVHVDHGVAYLVSENRRVTQDILLTPEDPKTAQVQPGMIVVAELIEYPSRYGQMLARVTEILGNYLDPGMEIEIALRKHELPFEFSDALKAEAKKLPKKVRKLDLKGREDLRHLPLVTIDGETAKDFDDAVYCERQGKGFRLIVAIADVSHYVKPGTALDHEGYERGNSVYFPRRVIPMLPEELSNELCSLKPEVDRLSMVCDMNISAAGKVANYRFYPAVIHSHARLTYEQVAAALYDGKIEAHPAIAVLLPHLQNLDALFRCQLKARAKRGAIDFETTETRMNFDDQGKILSIVPAVRNDAHKIIEECMLAANVCAANFLLEHEHPALYRVHDGPRPERLEKLRGFLAEFGLTLGGGDEPKASDYARLLDSIKPRPDFHLLQTVMLRSLSQAMYSPDNVGHFGLSYEAYTHFTSPIRRYPDLIVHRAIKEVLTQQAAPEADWDDIGLHCSQTERRADEATRDVEAWLKCFYMRERVGEEFDGSISAVVPFGLFVALDDVFVEGLVHISDLGSDYYQFDEVRHALVGERTGKQFRLADRVKVRLMSANMETNKIDFQLIDEPQRGRAKQEDNQPASAQAGRRATKPIKDDLPAVVNPRKRSGTVAQMIGQMAPRVLEKAKQGQTPVRTAADPAKRSRRKAPVTPEFEILSEKEHKSLTATDSPVKTKKAPKKAKPAKPAKAKKPGKAHPGNKPAKAPKPAKVKKVRKSNAKSRAPH